MRILLISYYFPPCGGAPVQRWLKWLPDLVEQGFQITVLTTRDGDYPQLDASLLEDIPAQVRILRAPTWKMEKLWKILAGKSSKLPQGNLNSAQASSPLYRFLVWIRLNLIIPDIRIIWNHSAWKEVSRFLRSNPIDAVITTGPPHSTHLLGRKIKKNYHIPWIADWRDPWTNIYYLQLNPPGILSRAIHRRLEYRVASEADLNITVSEHLAQQLSHAKTLVLYNGYDARKQALTGSAESKGTAFRVKYVGSITEGQNLTALIDILAQALGNSDFELCFVGTVLNPADNALLASRLPDRYRKLEYCSHETALKEMQDCELLVLLINRYPGFEGMLTTKLFEYIASRNPILCIGPHGGEAETIIGNYSAGGCFSEDETSQAVEFIQNLRLDWSEGKSTKNKAVIENLSSSRQAEKLADSLYRLKKR